MQATAQTPAKQPRAKPAKAPSKPAKALAAARAAPVQAKPAAPRYALGKAFVAKAHGRYPQAENWDALLPLLPATKEELVAALKKADRPNAAGFVQGRIRGGHIIAVPLGAAPL